MHITWSEQGDPGMVVLQVVPLEEITAELARILQAAETLWKPRLIF